MTENSDSKIGGLLLAAGGSSRLGQPKQLLQFEGRSLIRISAENLVASGCDPIVVVLGAETDRSPEELSDLGVGICINEEWQSGMSSSIKVGLKALAGIEPTLGGVLITLCDQPNITADMLGAFLSRFRISRPAMIAARYGEIVGVPALFSNELFEALFQLHGDTGARELIRQRNDIVTIDLDAAAFDIDTPDDIILYPAKKSLK